MLRDFHTVFLGKLYDSIVTLPLADKIVDDSTSMSGERWGQSREALMGVAETAANYDEAGVDIYFLNSKRVGKELRSQADVEDLFAGLDPRGATPSVLLSEFNLTEIPLRSLKADVSGRAYAWKLSYEII